MNKKMAALLVSAILIASTAEAAVTRDAICPSANSIHEAKFIYAYAPALFMFKLDNSLVIVSIPPSNDNQHPTQAQAQALLTATTAPYPNNLGAPCFYAPDATETTAYKPVVMWSDQAPPVIG